MLHSLIVNLWWNSAFGNKLQDIRSRTYPLMEKYWMKNSDFSISPFPHVLNKKARVKTTPFHIFGLAQPRIEYT